MIAERKDGSRNSSETLFEKYLALHGHTDWQYEVKVGVKRPDYRLTHNGSYLYLEVEGIRCPEGDAGSRLV